MVEPTIHRCLKDATIKLQHNQTDNRDYFDDASYVDSDADDTTLSFDTLATSGSSLHFQASSLTHPTTIRQLATPSQAGLPTREWTGLHRPDCTFLLFYRT